MKLGFADIDGIDFLRAVLEKAIGEAAGGGSHIDATFSFSREKGESGEGFFEFEATPTHEPFGLANAKNGFDGVLVSGLGGRDIIHEHFARQNQPLRFFAAFGKAAFDHQHIESLSFHWPLARRA